MARRGWRKPVITAAGLTAAATLVAALVLRTDSPATGESRTAGSGVSASRDAQTNTANGDGNEQSNTGAGSATAEGLGNTSEVGSGNGTGAVSGDGNDVSGDGQANDNRAGGGNGAATGGSSRAGGNTGNGTGGSSTARSGTATGGAGTGTGGASTNTITLPPGATTPPPPSVSVVSPPARALLKAGLAEFVVRSDESAQTAYWTVGGDDQHRNAMNKVPGLLEWRFSADLSGWSWSQDDNEYELSFCIVNNAGARGCEDVSVRVAAPDPVIALGSLQEGGTYGAATPFAVRLSGGPWSEVTWEVDHDHDHRTRLDVSGDGATASRDVDVSTWDWNGSGPYLVSFIAVASDGRSTSLDVNIFRG